MTMRISNIGAGEVLVESIQMLNELPGTGVIYACMEVLVMHEHNVAFHPPFRHYQLKSP